MGVCESDHLIQSRLASAFEMDRRSVLGRFLAAAFASPLALRRANAAEIRDSLPVIVLDPGHGGHDPGAVGVTGLFEKHVALATAQDLKKALEASGRYRVVLTREDDVYIPLERRSAFAQAQGARLFVSIHADALTDRAVRGASAYTLSSRASDAQSDELARRENSVDPAAAKEFAGYSPEVATILQSLASREARVLSARLQSDLVASLSKKVLMLHNPSRHGNFVVLRDTVPSVLVEMGFMSNRADEKLLSEPSHREEVVAALHRGIDRCMGTITQLGRVG